MKEYPGRMISILYRKSQIYFCQALKEHNLTTAEYPVLLHLEQAEGKTQEEVSSELSIDKSAITRAVQSLVDKGLVERIKDQQDKRCNRIYLTQKGKSSVFQVKQAVEDWNRIMTKHMTKNQIEEVMGLLSQMVDNIKEQK